MKIAQSERRKPAAADPATAAILAEISPERLRGYVEELAFPRHYFAENRANRRARDLLLRQVRDFGYQPSLQGTYDNIVVTSSNPGDRPFLLLGAHYDSVPKTPGADDNASAVAVGLECARIIRRHGIGEVMIVFFNREEDGLLGSSEFVTHLGERPDLPVAEAHILRWSAIATVGPARSPCLPACRCSALPQWAISLG